MNSFPHNSAPALRLVRETIEAVPPHSSQGVRLVEDARRAYEKHSSGSATKRIARETRRAAINPDMQSADPRWILAAEIEKELDGSALPPANRRRLLQLAHRLQLRPFDANLVIAVVQDAARCGTLGEGADSIQDSLAIIPSITHLGENPASTNTPNRRHSRRMWHLAVSAVASAILATLLFLGMLSWFFQSTTGV